MSCPREALQKFCEGKIYKNGLDSQMVKALSQNIYDEWKIWNDILTQHSQCHFLAEFDIDFVKIQCFIL